MKFFHISHTDLDGYGCQLVTKKIFPNGMYLNANYGLEVKNAIKIVLEALLEYKNDDIFLLISDLNLTIDESKNLDKNIVKLNKDGFNIKLQLLDHHGTGSKSANKYDWYYLDTNRCATKIVYEYFKENYSEFEDKCEENFDILIESINAVDIWLEDSIYFEFGKVCMSMIASAYEINNTLFSKENLNYRLYLLSKTLNYITKKDANIKLDEAIYSLKKEYLKLTSHDDTMDNLSSRYLVKMLVDKKDDLTVYCQGHKGLLTFTLGNISIPANTFLKANDDYDFFMDVSRRGKSSMRADGKLNVSDIASKIAGGGGHPNAAGMAFDDWTETTNYADVKKFIENKLQSIS